MLVVLDESQSPLMQGLGPWLASTEAVGFEKPEKVPDAHQHHSALAGCGETPLGDPGLHGSMSDAERPGDLAGAQREPTVQSAQSNTDRFAGEVRTIPVAHAPRAVQGVCPGSILWLRRHPMAARARGISPWQVLGAMPRLRACPPRRLAWR
jgi:hypothetical protein